MSTRRQRARKRSESFSSSSENSGNSSEDSDNATTASAATNRRAQQRRPPRANERKGSTDSSAPPRSLSPTAAAVAELSSPVAAAAARSFKQLSSANATKAAASNREKPSQPAREQIRKQNTPSSSSDSATDSESESDVDTASRVAAWKMSERDLHEEESEAEFDPNRIQEEDEEDQENDDNEEDADSKTDSNTARKRQQQAERLFPSPNPPEKKAAMGKPGTQPNSGATAPPPPHRMQIQIDVTHASHPPLHPQSQFPRPPHHHRSTSSSSSIPGIASLSSASASPASAAPPPTPNPFAHLKTGEYLNLPLASRLEYEAHYAKKWKGPISFLLDQLLSQYTWTPPKSADIALPSPSERSQRSVSMIEPNRSVLDSPVISEYDSQPQEFDADISSPSFSNPLSSPQSASSALHPAVSSRGTLQNQHQHQRSASTISSFSAIPGFGNIHSYTSSFQKGHGNMSEREREEAERHSLAKGKLKIQAALLRKKQFEWNRLVQSGQATWAELEAQEEEEQERRHRVHAEKHREITKRLIDPRDHAALKRAHESAWKEREMLAKTQQIVWYWNSIPVSAIAIMRVLVHNHAFDAVLPLASDSFASSNSSSHLAPTKHSTSVNSSESKKNGAGSSKISDFLTASSHARLSSFDATLDHRPQLCRTWILSDLLYGLRVNLISIVKNEIDHSRQLKEVLLSPRSHATASPSLRSNSLFSAAAASPNPLVSPMSASSSAFFESFPNSPTGSGNQHHPSQMNARLVYLINNLAVLLHFVKRFAIQQDEAARAKALESELAQQDARSAAEDDGKSSKKKSKKNAQPVENGHSASSFVSMFRLPPTQWATSFRIEYPSTDPQQMPSDPLAQLSADVSQYVYDQDEEIQHASTYAGASALGVDSTSGDPEVLYWFFKWLLRLSNISMDYLLYHLYHSSSLASYQPEDFLSPQSLLALGSDSLDGFLESLGQLYEQCTAYSLLPLIKAQLFQCLLEQFVHGLLKVIITDPHLQHGKSKNTGSLNGKGSSGEATHLISSRLLSNAVPLGMKLSMIYSGIQDWSQRVTAFTHPFVQSVKLTLAPLRETTLFCLLDDKSELQTLDAFDFLAPSTPRAILLALCQRYNSLPNNEDLVEKKVIQQLKKAVQRQKDEDEILIKRANKENGIRTTFAEKSNSSSSPSSLSASLSATSPVAAAALSSTEIYFPALPQFTMDFDLSQQLGKFVLNSVDLPAQLTNHPAFQFLKKKDDPLVL